MQELDAILPVLGVEHIHAVGLEHAGEGKDVSHIVVDNEDPSLLEHLVGGVQLLQHPALLLRQLPFDAMKEERRLVEQPLGRARVLDDDRLRELLQLRLLIACQLLAGVDDHRDRRVPVVLLELLEQREPAHVGKLEVEHHAVEVLQLECLQRCFARTDCGHLDLFVAADQLDNRLAL